MRTRGRAPGGMEMRLHPRVVPIWAVLPALLLGLAVAAMVFVGAVVIALLTAPFRAWVRHGSGASRPPAPPAPPASSVPPASPAGSPAALSREIEDAHFEEVV